ncbi:MAG TPA: EAL domain-containing protein [Clostridia bacterium]|nr:EAL domain-containing protein [Clostridia bacterium]
MPDRTNPPQIEHYIDLKFQSVANKPITWIKIGIGMLAYALMIYFQKWTLGMADNSLNGIISQMQVMISVYLVISVVKIGYYGALLLNGIQLFLVTKQVVANKEYNAAPGVIIPICVIIIITIIYAFERRLNRKMSEVIKQSEEIASLCEELSATEGELSQQNQQLMEYNSRMKENEERLNYLAYYDGLTGLPNRKMIFNKLEMLVNASMRNQATFAVVFIDLDNFKRINDTMGHNVGDLLLQLVVSRLENVICKKDILGRLGGDEFALIIQRSLKDTEILEYVEQVRSSLLKPFLINRTEVNISASLGISIFPQDGDDSEELLKSADTAMYKAKDYGKNAVQFFCKEMKDEILKKIEFEKALLAAIHNGEIYLVYQPQYYSGTKKLRGGEVLVRWQSHVLGKVNPVEFIPIAEETGFIIPLGEWILRTACKEVCEIRKKGFNDIIISVNISAVQIMEPSFVQMVSKILRETGIDGTCLEFEITESVFISSMEYAIRVLNELKKMKIRIALDDFGTGYSSLNYIQQLPIDTLKIDKTFISSISNGNSKKQIVGSIISLIHQMDIAVVAEGVENEEQLHYLKEYQCDFIQGYLWGKPLGREEFEKTLAMPMQSNMAM